jgi:hypothetical protein
VYYYRLQRHIETEIPTTQKAVRFFKSMSLWKKTVRNR